MPHCDFVFEWEIYLYPATDTCLCGNSSIFFYPVHTAHWDRAELNRATLYDQSFDTTELCWKWPPYGWGAAMVQFSYSSVQLHILMSEICNRAGPDQFVLARSVNAILYCRSGH